MKKINKLIKEKQILNKKINNYNNISNMSIKQFISYKYTISKEIKLNKKIRLIENTYKKTNIWYNSVTTNWINDSSISCKKFSKLEKKAHYKLQKKLFKLGYSNQAPLPPFLQTIYIKIHPINTNNKTQIQKKILKQQQKSLSQFKKVSLSSSIPNLSHKFAINCAKKCIIGYRIIQNDINYFRKYLSYTSSVQYLKSIKSEALNELNLISNTSNFKDSLKITIPSQTPNTIKNSKKTITQNNLKNYETNLSYR